MGWEGERPSGQHRASHPFSVSTVCMAWLFSKGKTACNGGSVGAWMRMTVKAEADRLQHRESEQSEKWLRSCSGSALGTKKGRQRRP